MHEIHEKQGEWIEPGQESAYCMEEIYCYIYIYIYIALYVLETLTFSTFSLIVMILFIKDVLGRESHVRILKSNLLNLVFVILLMGRQILP